MVYAEYSAWEFEVAILNKTNGWERTDLERIPAAAMDADRIRLMLSNIENSMASAVNSKDNKKLRDLKSFFEKELRRRGK